MHKSNSSAPIIIRRFIYKFFGLINYIFPNPAPVVVLCYHSLGNDSWRFSIPLSRFKKQIQLLLKSHQFITIDDFEKYLNGNVVFSKPAILLTFDDGYKNILSTVEYLSKLKIYPLAFLLSSLNNLDVNELDNKLSKLNTQDVNRLLRNGWCIGSHSDTHPYFKKIDSDKLKSEISGSKKLLEDKFKLPIKYFSYPKGAYTQSVVKEVKKAGYTLAFSMDDEVIGTDSNKLNLSRIGVDSTHEIAEIPGMISVYAIYFRKYLKKYLPFLSTM